MEWRVHVGSGVGDHVDPADLEGRAVVKVRGAAFPLPEVADVRAGKALVGRHAMLDHMAEVDDPFLFHSRHNATPAISIQTTLRAAEGIAWCHHPLITNPAAPTRFIH